jgi:hypothetical protein
MKKDGITKEEFLAGRKVAGQAINVETCEIAKIAVDVVDPYGVGDDGIECIGRLVFVESAESDGWVYVGDLPEDKARALHDRIERGYVRPIHDDWPLFDDL